jgi:hypothetical protein
LQVIRAGNMVCMGLFLPVIVSVNKNSAGDYGTMNALAKTTIFFAALYLCLIPSVSSAGTSVQLGAGYGFDVRSGAHLEQYEVFLRAPLPYSTRLFNTEVATAAEFGLGYIQDWDSRGSGATRFSIMPEVVVAPHGQFSLVLGLGAGFLAGNTKFSGHDLGGPLLFTFKCGVQYHINEHWGIEDAFYHQSNADMYSHNYSLDMNQLTLSYTF